VNENKTNIKGENNIKAIFLDFDGVINDYLTMNEINDYNVEILKRIIAQTDAKIVVTSSHKYPWQMANNQEGMLKNNGIIKGLRERGVDVFDCTPMVENREREQEIIEYLKKHPEIIQYVILDDDYIIEALKEHEIFLDLQAGLRERHIIPTIRILNGELNFYHDCTDEQLNETPEERLIRMNVIFGKILNGQSSFYDDCTDAQFRKKIEERIISLKKRFNKKQDSGDMER